MTTYNARAHRAKIARAREFFEKYHSGMTYQQIADEYGLTRQRAWQLVRDYAKVVLPNEPDLIDLTESDKSVLIPDQREPGERVRQDT